MSSRDVAFTKDKLMRLRRAYNLAKADKKETFVFEGKEYLVDYAKYLIEYLAKKLE